MADILTVAQATDNLTPSARRGDMLIDWQNGMRQVDIAAKYGCSQGTVSKLIGGSPRTRNTPEPTAAEYRARCLLALALVNHRRTDAGLSATDTSAVKAALHGVWDEAVA